MNYTIRQSELNKLFQLGTDTCLHPSGIHIRFYNFISSAIETDPENYSFSLSDRNITENTSFVYPVFIPKNKPKNNKAILLLHGLNERSWSKYLCWAEHLCLQTGKAVILFPIAFHMNRSPQSWWNPRELKSLLENRRKKNGDDRMLSFANLTFSERIAEHPYRFYNAGRQSLNDLSILFETIKNGKHPAFFQHTDIDIFAYSIGAFLAEITRMVNPKGLFTDSKLFLFCGGGVFSAMFGKSRCIMDRAAYDQLFEYYQYKFINTINPNNTADKVLNWFNCMISPERNKTEREQFFATLRNKLSGIALSNDKVMPFYGIAQAIGHEMAISNIRQTDFNFEYAHENPFPTGNSVDPTEVNAAFTNTFDQICEFLA